VLLAVEQWELESDKYYLNNWILEKYSILFRTVTSIILETGHDDVAPYPNRCVGETDCLESCNHSKGKGMCSLSS